MFRWEVTSGIASARVIGIVRADSGRAAVEIGRALWGAGLTVIEVALTTPDGFAAIEELASDVPRGATLGAGTVLDASGVELAIDAGAQFVVSPGLDPQVVRSAHLRGVPAIPGASTATEIMSALGLGADLIKLFPASQLGVGHLRAVRAALPQAAFVPTGGVDVGNAREWLEAGAVALGVGGALSRGDAHEVERRAKELLKVVEDLPA